MDAHLGGEVLRRFALEDVLSSQGADLHQRGDLHLDGLACPHRPLVLSVPAELLLQGSPGAQTPVRLLPRLGQLLAMAGQGLVLEDLEPALTGVGRGHRALGVVTDFLLAAGGMAQSMGRELELAGPGGRAGRWGAVLIEAT